MKLLLVIFLMALTVSQAQTIKDDSSKTNVGSEKISLRDITPIYSPNNIYNLPSDEYLTDQFMKRSLLDNPSLNSLRMSVEIGNDKDRISDNWESSVLNPLHQMYIDKQSMSFFRQVLCTIQLGAVGYLAYKHLKKYGFLKKK